MKKFNKIYFYSIFLIFLKFFIIAHAQDNLPKPVAASNVIISDVSTSSLKISWEPAINTDYYNIYRESQDYYQYGIFIGSTSQNFFIDRTVLPNSKYSYAVESVNSFYNENIKPTKFGNYGAMSFAQPSFVYTKPLPYYDFYLYYYGPLNVYRGYTIYIGVGIKTLSSTTQNVYVNLITPPEIAATITDYYHRDSRGLFVYQPSNSRTAIKVTTFPTTPLGDYKIRFIAESQDKLIKKEILIPVKVIDLPNLNSKPLPVLPSLPFKSLWEENMIKFGKKLCHFEPCCGYELNNWYYDGLRTFYNILDYTRDAYWLECISVVRTNPNPKLHADSNGNPLNSYRDHIWSRISQGSETMWGWRVFTQGLTIDYQRTHDWLSKYAALFLINKSAYVNHLRMHRYWDLVSSVVSREVAYVINAFLDGIKLNNPRNDELKVYVDMALGHLDQWFDQPNSPVPYVQPFMFGLTAEALITYYEEYEKDPRILIAIKKGLDWIWENMLYQEIRSRWENYPTTSKGYSFLLISHPNIGEGYKATIGGNPDLNLMIAPAYAWYYHLTGDEEYIRRGDLLFETGAKGAWLERGKHFNENYRWSFKYLEWRDGYKLTPYIPPTSSFLSDYRQYLKIALFSDNYNPQSGNIITYRAILKNISTTTLIRTKFSFPLFSDQKYVEDSAYLTINNIKYRSISYRPHQLIILIPYLSPQQQATLIWKMIKK
ncbi:MAG: hypothetical protein KatS3mg093_172 [Candidatus Parcubacteria bacterium]|nr:MAG: hypothetical protein KatS3mg093_172 [Candidatus Parcubacteria bacterium]